MPAAPTIRLTVAQAVVTYLSRQYSVADGERRRLIPATLGIFGHGNVAGLGQALDQLNDTMPFIQGRNEQALVHAAVGFAKHSRRRATLAVTASIGPGAMNMTTGAALATINRLPVLLLPGDTYATRHQGPVLQQLQHPVDGDLSVNDAFRPISRFFDRITRPEQLLTALPAAMRTLVDPVETGAVVLSLAAGRAVARLRLPRRVLRRARLGDPAPRPGCRRGRRRRGAARLGQEAGHHRRRWRDLLRRHRRARGPRGRRRRSRRRDLRRQGCGADRGLVAGRRHRPRGDPATNTLVNEADVVLTVGSRLTDFATGSHSIFANPDVRFASLNVNVHDADRLGATGVVADAKRGLAALTEAVTALAVEPDPLWRARVEELVGAWRPRALRRPRPRPAVRQVRGRRRAPTS